ncbi:hypothetical protein GGQ86_000362 [Xanthobacter flavus]|nr:hypothetical protein [Xanthobacter flavus]MDR6331915.1 hypothetical protein [Xanthobacter flavus]
MRVVLALAGASLLAGCATSFTVPAAVRLNKGELLYGSTTASTSGGRFEVTELHGKLRCGGSYDPFDHAPTISADFSCSDGRTGTITVTRRTDAPGGSGSLRMNDGTTGYVAFGADTQTITAGVAAPSPRPEPPSVSSNTTRSTGTVDREQGKKIVVKWTECAVIAATRLSAGQGSATEIAQAALGLCLPHEGEYRKYLLANHIGDDFVGGVRENIANIATAAVLKTRQAPPQRRPEPTVSPKRGTEEI